MTHWKVERMDGPDNVMMTCSYMVGEVEEGPGPVGKRCNADAVGGYLGDGFTPRCAEHIALISKRHHLPLPKEIILRATRTRFDETLVFEGASPEALVESIVAYDWGYGTIPVRTAIDLGREIERVWSSS